MLDPDRWAGLRQNHHHQGDRCVVEGPSSAGNAGCAHRAGSPFSTGSIFTTNEKHKEEARRRFHVGNFYINRKCTGALVGAHPFGGFNMSGTDSKAGGPDYLLQFLQAKTISEKIG